MIFQHDNVSFYYKRLGTGLPILFLHGNGEDHTYFDQQVPFFIQQGYQCILMDMRGHGQSSLGEEELNFTLFAKDVCAFLLHLHIEKICMLGFSDGANTVMQFALEYPQMLEVMILNGGNLYLKGMIKPYQIAIIMQYHIVCLLSKIISRYNTKKQILKLMAKYPNIKTEDLQNLHIPTLVIVGEKDMIKHSHSVLIKECIKDAKFVELNKGDHFIAQKQADRFNMEVIQFLKEVSYEG